MPTTQQPTHIDHAATQQPVGDPATEDTRT
jgi:hypothetical protein